METKPHHYKSRTASETVDPRALTPPCKLINGKVVDATWSEILKEWVFEI